MNRLLKIVLLIIVGTLLATLAWGVQNTGVSAATVDGKGVQKIEMPAGEFSFTESGWSFLYVLGYRMDTRS